MTWQRIWPARGVVPKTLPITAILAGLAVKAAAHAQKVLVNGWQALRRPSTEVTRWLVPSTIAAFPWDSGDAANAGALTRSTRLPGTCPTAPRTTEEPEPGPQSPDHGTQPGKSPAPPRNPRSEDQQHHLILKLLPPTPTSSRPPPFSGRSSWADGRHTVAARAHDDRLGTWQASVRVSGVASPPVRPATTSRRPRATRRELMCVSALRSVASNV